MRVVIPLAGPDFEQADGSVKAERLVEGRPLLRQALESRSWWREGRARAAETTFVLHDGPATRRFADSALTAWFPEAQVVFVSGYTQGAALSALAGLAPVAHDVGPVCIDLADILFEEDGSVGTVFGDPAVGGALLTFPATSPLYSYVRRDARGKVVETIEKVVISGEASAGVYLFRSAGIYLKAVAHALENRDSQTCRGLFFVCPLMNGVLAQGLDVVGVPVHGVRDIKVL